MTAHATILKAGDIAAGVKLIRFRAPDAIRGKVDHGSHLGLHLGLGLTRKYSVLDVEGLGSFSIAVQQAKQSRGGSAYIHASHSAGMKVANSRPRNAFKRREDGFPLPIAAGIGTTPILSMSADLRLRSAPHGILYVGRAENSPLIDRLQGATIFVNPLRSAVLDCVRARLQRRSAARAVVHVCGPIGFVTAVQEPANNDLCPGRGSSEAFAKGKETSGRTFGLKLQRSGRLVTVQPSQTILQAIEQEGIQAPSSCRQGTCWRG